MESLKDQQGEFCHAIKRELPNALIRRQEGAKRGLVRGLNGKRSS